MLSYVLVTYDVFLFDDGNLKMSKIQLRAKFIFKIIMKSFIFHEYKIFIQIK